MDFFFRSKKNHIGCAWNALLKNYLFWKLFLWIRCLGYHLSSLITRDIRRAPCVATKFSFPWNFPLLLQCVLGASETHRMREERSTWYKTINLSPFRNLVLQDPSRENLPKLYPHCPIIVTEWCRLKDLNLRLYLVSTFQIWTQVSYQRKKKKESKSNKGKRLSFGENEAFLCNNT